ncbi:Alpha-tocopherol transfer protein-like [Eumeta japonica]|uniref:Alpha-tocopherol transfer protein-like n=1 Tax=Eumeta variegata TaxID=151549 RepID=A0A4C1SYG7_EUMVA|nr:Alpha-tocopherol transfer protein-like [Eumeta japonica]
MRSLRNMYGVPLKDRCRNSDVRERCGLKEDVVTRVEKDDKDLHVPLHSDAWLVRFLRPCKFYPESAYELIKRYYAFKVKHKKQYDGLMPSKEQNIFKQNILTVLPNRDQYGRRVLVIELGKKWKHNECSLDEVFKGCVLFLEAAMLEPESQICGAVVIFDMDGLSMQQVWQFTPPFAKRIVDWLQESIPLRIKGLYIVNQPYIFNMVFQLFKPFLQEKLRNRIVFMGTDRELLYKYISPKCLPENYGGTLSLPVVTGQQWLELLLMCDQEFSDQGRVVGVHTYEVQSGQALRVNASITPPESAFVSDINILLNMKENECTRTKLRQFITATIFWTPLPISLY